MEEINITWIIGNGFDISANMKTSYYNFYESDIFNEHKSNNSLYRIIDDEKVENKLWSDYELALGNYTHNLEESDLEKFCEDSEQFIIDFNSYLRLEDENTNISNERILAFKNTLFNFVKFFREEKRDRLPSSLKSSYMHFYHSFFQFNYTSFLDELIDKTFKSGSITEGSHRKHIKRSNAHVHGVLNRDDSHNIIIGCDNEDQYSTNFLQNTTHSSLINKKNLNTALANQYIEKGFAIITQTHVFVSFGTSFGETDLTWWKNIYNQLASDQCLGLLILKYSPDFINKKNRPTIFPTTVQRAKKDFFRHFTDEEIEEIQHKVFVSIVGDIGTPFDFFEKG